MDIALILKSPTFEEEVTEDTVIYADAVYKHKDKVGDKTVLAVVGDFDSLGKAPSNEKTVGLNVEKNYTDGERALRYAFEKGFDRVVIYGAFGGKMEHVLGNIALLKIARDLGKKAVIKNGDTVMELLEKSVSLRAKKDSALSLIPYGGDCKFIKSENLYYALDGLTLTPSDTRGISNVVMDENVQIDIENGFALAIYTAK
jgi:thiamine pyrophosphokinase